MWLKFYIITLLIFIVKLNSAQIPNDYYNSANDLSGEFLKTTLHNIIKDHTEYPYTSSSTDIWDILKETDKDTLNPDNVILFYSGWSVNAAQEYNSAQGWSREHVWAKSHGSFDTDIGIGTDVHSLKPCDISVNSARGNDDFDNGGEIYIDGDGETECRTDYDSWEARDAVKGDVARMLFYMATRYNGGNDEPDLKLVDAVNTYEIDGTEKGYHGKLSTLLQWHKEDPVDSFEIRRNDIIYSYQGNRNPYIDHPEYVEKIWSAATGTGFMHQSDKIRIYPNPAKNYLIIDSSSDEMVNGMINSLTGESVLRFEMNNSIRLSIKNLKSGLYFVLLEIDNYKYTSKFIINN